MSQALEVKALARVEEYTKIRFLSCENGDTEFSFDEADLILETSEPGLRNLADAVNAAVRDREDRNAVT